MSAIRVVQCHSCDNLRKFNIRDHCRTSLPHLLGHASCFRVSGYLIALVGTSDMNRKSLPMNSPT